MKNKFNVEIKARRFDKTHAFKQELVSIGFDPNQIQWIKPRVKTIPTESSIDWELEKLYNKWRRETIEGTWADMKPTLNFKDEVIGKVIFSTVDEGIGAYQTLWEENGDKSGLRRFFIPSEKFRSTEYVFIEGDESI